MIFRFDSFELDTARRELRAGGTARAVQPRVFAVLEYLVRHRDRVVSKDELLGKLWPDTIVTDASLQRAISLARDAIDDNGTRLRTVPRQGYRFVAPVEVPAAEPVHRDFRPRFVASGDVHIAYHTIGSGPIDIVVVLGWVFPMRAYLDQPDVGAWLDPLTRLGRVVLFDKRGTGLSDRVKALPALEQRVDDLRAVLDAIGSSKAVLVGRSEGGPLALMYAASFPERVQGLVLLGAFARWAAAPDYPQGWSPEVLQELREYIATGWGKGYTVRAVLGSRANDPALAAWAARAEIEGASPGAARDLLDMNLQLDVRPLLPAVSVPTVVLHCRNDPVISVDNGRYLAAHIPGARLIEIDGQDHMFLSEGADAFHDAVKWVAAQPHPADVHFLTTILAAELEGTSTRPETLDETVAKFKGVRAGDGASWSFDGPQRAINCAHALLAQPAAAGMRVGVHAGEVARRSGRLVGEAVNTARAIALSAPPGAIWVSQVLRDLVHGSPLAFTPQLDVTLPGGRSLPVLASDPPREITKR